MQWGENKVINPDFRFIWICSSHSAFPDLPWAPTTSQTYNQWGWAKVEGSLCCQNENIPNPSKNVWGSILQIYSTHTKSFMQNDIATLKCPKPRNINIPKWWLMNCEIFVSWNMMKPLKTFTLTLYSLENLHIKKRYGIVNILHYVK